MRLVLITDHRHRFVTDEPAVKLKIGGNEFEWSEKKNDHDSRHCAATESSKRIFWITGRYLKSTTFRPDEKGEIDPFSADDAQPSAILYLSKAGKECEFSRWT